MYKYLKKNIIPSKKRAEYLDEKFKALEKLRWNLGNCYLYKNISKFKVTSVTDRFVQYYCYTAIQNGIEINDIHLKFIETSLKKNYYNFLCSSKKCESHLKSYSLITSSLEKQECKNAYFSFHYKYNRDSPNTKNLHASRSVCYSPLSLKLTSANTVVQNIDKYQIKDIYHLNQITKNIYFRLNRKFILDLPGIFHCLMFKRYTNVNIKIFIIRQIDPMCLCKYTHTNGVCIKDNSNCIVCDLTQCHSMDYFKQKYALKCFCDSIKRKQKCKRK